MIDQHAQVSSHAEIVHKGWCTNSAQNSTESGGRASLSHRAVVMVDRDHSETGNTPAKRRTDTHDCWGCIINQSKSSTLQDPTPNTTMSEAPNAFECGAPVWAFAAVMSASDEEQQRPQRRRRRRDTDGGRDRVCLTAGRDDDVGDESVGAGVGAAGFLHPIRPFFSPTRTTISEPFNGTSSTHTTSTSNTAWLFGENVPRIVDCCRAHQRPTPHSPSLPFSCAQNQHRHESCQHLADPHDCDASPRISSAEVVIVGSPRTSSVGAVHESTVEMTMSVEAGPVPKSLLSDGERSSVMRKATCITMGAGVTTANRRPPKSSPITIPGLRSETSIAPTITTTTTQNDDEDRNGCDVDYNNNNNTTLHPTRSVSVGCCDTDSALRNRVASLTSSPSLFVSNAKTPATATISDRITTARTAIQDCEDVTVGAPPNSDAVGAVDDDDDVDDERRVSSTSMWLDDDFNQEIADLMLQQNYDDSTNGCRSGCNRRELSPNSTTIMTLTNHRMMLRGNNVSSQSNHTHHHDHHQLDNDATMSNCGCGQATTGHTPTINDDDDDDAVNERDRFLYSQTFDCESPLLSASPFHHHSAHITAALLDEELDALGERWLLDEEYSRLEAATRSSVPHRQGAFWTTNTSAPTTTHSNMASSFYRSAFLPISGVYK